MTSEALSQVKIYYDGLCLLCSREMDHYRSKRGADKIKFIDICSDSFDPQQEGLDPRLVHKVMHVRRADGTLATRVDAFIAIWEALPDFAWLAKLARRPFLSSCLEWGYSLFIKIRPLLPRRQKAVDCSASPFCEVKHAKTTRKL